jgi:hypothetical protein
MASLRWKSFWDFARRVAVTGHWNVTLATQARATGEQIVVHQTLKYGTMRVENGRLVFTPVVREMFIPYYVYYFDRS